MSSTVLAELPAVPESLAPLRSEARSVAERCGAADDVVSDIVLAVSEACTNVVVHAYRDRQPGNVALAAEAENGHVLFRVTDDGEGLTPRPDSPGMGLGLPLIARLAESFEVLPGPDGHGTELCMRFSVAA